MAKCCSTIKNPCPSYPNAACVVYTGVNLTCSEIKTNDRLDTILEKIDEKLCSVGAGIYMDDGVTTTVSGNGTEFNPFIVEVRDNVFWETLGNSGTSATTNFLGTTDLIELSFRINGAYAGRIGFGNLAFGDYENGITAYGYKAGEAIITAGGYGVTAIGNRALQDYTGGTLRGIVAIGSGALRDNLTGQRITAVGDFAGFHSSAGQYNSWYGVFSGEMSEDGIMNTGAGAESLRGLKDGYYNSGFGGRVLYRSTTIVESVTIDTPGSGYTTATCTFSAPDTASPGTVSTTATGTVTLSAGAVTGIVITNPGSGYTSAHGAVTVTITGDGTGATGTVVLRSAEGNTALGYVAGGGNYASKYDIHIGYFAGWGTTGYYDENNIFIGTNAQRDSALSSSTPLTKATAIGYNAKASTSNTLILGGVGADQINVGIGTLTPGKYLEVYGSDILVHNHTIGRGGGSIATNVAFGYQALNATITGTARVGIGYQALLLDNGGQAGQTVIGYQAAGNLTDAGQSVAIGYRAMYGSGGATRKQRHSIAIGTHALENAGHNGSLALEANIGIGQNSLVNLTFGYNNTMVGWGTGTAYTTQAYNTGLGLGALYQATGEYQIGIGISTLASNSGNASIAIGYYAGYSSTTASSGIYIGYRSGFQITTGNNNVIIGGHEGASIATSDNNVLIADGQGNQRLLINSSGAYSIGGGNGTAGQVLTSNGSAASPTWQNAPGAGSGSTITTDSFDASTDWGSASGGYYSYAFAHGLGTNDYLIQIWDDTGTPVATTVQIEQTDTNTVTLKVTETPDNRFAGRIIIVSL